MILLNQMLILTNILKFSIELSLSDIEYALDFIYRHIKIMDLHITGNILFRQNGKMIEFIIPVNKQFQSNEMFQYQKAFKLTNAVGIKHISSLHNIPGEIEMIKRYIESNSLTAITSPYISVHDDSLSEFDLYIGVSENTL